MNANPEPYIVYETPSFLIVYKPHGLHTAPLKLEESDNLLAWCAVLRPELLRVKGLKTIEHGLLHRLDGETDGLVLLAKTQKAFDAIISSQQQGHFIKEYVAVCEPAVQELPGFPFPPRSVVLPLNLPFMVESGFRAFGPGRQAVRPIDMKTPRTSGKECALDQGIPYKTEILEASQLEAASQQTRFRVRLFRGFRHQVRCHLAWLGYPIIGDTLYGSAVEGVLGLSAVVVVFPEPETGKLLRFSLDGIISGKDRPESDRADP